MNKLNDFVAIHISPSLNKIKNVVVVVIVVVAVIDNLDYVMSL